MAKKPSSFDFDEAACNTARRDYAETRAKADPNDRPLEPGSPESRAMTKKSRPSRKPDGFKGIGLDEYGHPIVRTPQKPFGKRKHL